jgi:putative transcriptional regulator
LHTLRLPLRIHNVESVAGNKGERRGCAVHNRLAILRAERGVSRAELAGAVGVNPQTIGFIERGDYGPSLEVALRICDFFGLPVEAVFALTPLTPMSTQLYRPETGDPR